MKRLLRVLGGEALDVPPVWLMRQAGRYLPEYRAVRARAGSFLELCYTPELAEEVTLIGVAGAPWTVARYMVAGRGTPDQGPARAWMYREPAGFVRLIDLITQATIHYLGRQIEAGAEAVKLFDSWAGSLAAEMFVRFAIEPARKIVAANSGYIAPAPRGNPITGTPG